jgi:vacuolar-type H+-ATPase subunit H
MRSKIIPILLIAALAYIIGTHAERDRYEELKRSLTKAWNDPDVKKARKKAKKVRAKAGAEAQKRAKKLASRLG